MRILPLAVLTLISAGILWSVLGASQAADATLAELPRDYVDTRYIEPDGQVLRLAAGDDLQRALNLAQPGDVIELEAGAVFIGPFTLPDKPAVASGSPWIIIRSSEMNRLPGETERVTPADAALMPRLVASYGSVISTEPGAHHYRFMGVEITPANSADRSAMEILRSVPAILRGNTRVTGQGVFLTNLVLLGDGEASVEELPHHLIFDRCYIHGDPLLGARRGVALNSRSSAVINSHLSDFKEVGADSQAIAGWNGPGPFAIINNYLEGAGENLMFGGAQSSISQLVPADIEVKGNHFHKPLQWREGDDAYAGVPWSVKNIFELKNARRVLVEGNLLEHNWPYSQNGFAILFTVRNEGGTMPWAVVEDVTFRHNVVRNVGSGFNLLGRDDNGRPSQPTARIHIDNNLFVGLGGSWGAGSFLQMLDGVRQVRVSRNTILNEGQLVFVEGEPIEGFEFLNNIASHRNYGISGSGTAPGSETQARYLPSSSIRNNLIIGGRMQLYPDSNRFPLDLSQVGFIDAEAGNFRLQDTSRFREGDTEATGVDLDLLCTALSRRERDLLCVPKE